MKTTNDFTKKAIEFVNKHIEATRIESAKEALGRGNFELVDVDENLSYNIDHFMGIFGEINEKEGDWWLSEYGSAEELLEDLTGYEKKPEFMGEVNVPTDIFDDIITMAEEDAARGCDEEGNTYEIEGYEFEEGGVTYELSLTVYYWMTPGRLLRRGDYWNEDEYEEDTIDIRGIEAVRVCDHVIGDDYKVSNIKEIEKFLKKEYNMWFEI